MQRRNFLKSGIAFLGVTALALNGCGSDFEPVLPEPPPNGGPTPAPTPTPRPTLVSLDAATGFQVASPTGELYLVDPVDHTLSRFAPDGSILWTVGDLGSGDGVFNFPSDLDFDAQGRLYVLDRGNREIDILDRDGDLVGTIGTGLLEDPVDLIFSTQDDLIYVADSALHQVIVLSPSGALIRTIGEFGLDEQQLNGPRGVALDSDGDLHVADTGNARIQVFSRSGAWLGSYGAYGTGDGQLLSARAILWVPSVQEMWVADTSAAEIVVFSKDGDFLDEFTPILENGSSIHPLHLGLGPDNVVYISGTEAFQG